MLAIIGFMPTPSQGTIGSLDYPVEERKKLAKKSLGFISPVCGPVADLLKAKKENVTSMAEEAKEIIKTMSIKVTLLILMCSGRSNSNFWIFSNRTRTRTKIVEPEPNSN